MSMYGCIGMKYITEICNTEDLCPKQQLTGITWSVATKSQCRKWVFYIHFLLHFTLITTNEGAKANCVCDFFPHTATEGAWATMLEREMKTSQILLEVTFCSAVMVRLCSRIVMFPRLCSNAATRWAWNQTTQEEFVLFPQKGVFLQVLHRPTQCTALFVV